MTSPTSQIDGVKFDSIPKGRVQRAKPAPYSRPSITVGGKPEDKRAWKVISARDLKEGDTIPGLGTVTEVVEEVKTFRTNREGMPGIVEARVSWTITVAAGYGNERVYDGNDEVWAFTR